MLVIREIEKRINGIAFFELKNENVRMIVTNLGCHIISIFTKDKYGIEGDIVLGFENVEDCLNDGTYMGAIVGRVANRIKGATFDLNGITYPLAANNGPNHLHGGEHGFNQKLFLYDILEDGIEFTYESPDMEEGYPGNLLVKIRYTLHDNCFAIEYKANCDQDTLCNLTNHVYFNLSAGKSKIYDHQLMIKADKIGCVDENCCANGMFLSVKNSPFDFTDFHKIGERIFDNHKQLILAGGYDHPFLLNAKKDQAVLFDPDSGRKVTISTTMPYIQVYSGNFLEGGNNGKHGRSYKNRDGVALETQYLPDSIHLEENSPVILRKEEVYKSVTEYKFEVES
ncbi:MAG: aldose epimerase family protein [Lachnospiraceae bacterium]|nr:aldose epimerase family protein [Lachnospiraceae bacterium]